MRFEEMRLEEMRLEEMRGVEIAAAVCPRKNLQVQQEIPHINLR
jgi:hypothetical protein